MSRISVDIGGELTLARRRAVAGVAPSRIEPITRTPAARSAARSWLAANAAGWDWIAEPFAFASPRLNSSALSGAPMS